MKLSEGDAMLKDANFVRAKAVYKRLGISRSGFYAMVKAKELPKPILLSERVAVWLTHEIDQIIMLIMSGANKDGLRTLAAQIETSRKIAWS